MEVSGLSYLLHDTAFSTKVSETARAARRYAPALSLHSRQHHPPPNKLHTPFPPFSIHANLPTLNGRG
ncbi:uncharacterized [Tachysurus ichikawai]